MSIDVYFHDEQELVPEDMEARLTNLIQTGARVLGVNGGELSVSFVTDEMIRQLNRDYRELDQATDVLSFPMYTKEELYEDGKLLLPESEELMWGDILISVPTAERQAREYGHSLARELGFLLVHGFLHLLGHDHDHAAGEKVMFRLQEHILAEHHLVR